MRILFWTSILAMTVSLPAFGQALGSFTRINPLTTIPSSPQSPIVDTASSAGSCPTGYDKIFSQTTFTERINNCHSGGGTPKQISKVSSGQAYFCFSCDCIGEPGSVCESRGQTNRANGALQAGATVQTCGDPWTCAASQHSGSAQTCADPLNCTASQQADNSGKKSVSANVPTPTPRPDPSTTKSSSTKKSTDQAAAPAASPTGNASVDLQTCQQKATDANQCCQNPMSCLNQAVQYGYVNPTDAALAQEFATGSAMAGGIQQSCTTLQQASLAMQNVNQGLSALCYAKKSACESTCQGDKQTYKTTSFDGAISSCQALGTNVVALGASAQQNVQTAMISAQCQQVTSASTPAAASNTPTTYPVASSDVATGGASNSPPVNSDESLFNNPPITGTYTGTDPSASASSFDVAATTDTGNVPQNNVGSPTAAVQPTAAAVVPNNTGGGLPGSGAFGVNSKNSNATTPRGPHSNTGSVSANVLRGERSSGGFVQGGGGNSVSSSVDSSGFNLSRINPWARRRRTGGQDLSKYQGLDLKKYLPGGALDPQRGLATLSNSQIRSQGDDLFQVMSVRYRVLCKLGNLFDCP